MNETVMFPCTVVKATKDEFQGNAYYTLQVDMPSGDRIVFTGKADFDFPSVEGKAVVLECEIRGKAKGNQIRPDLRAIKAHPQKKGGE